MVLFSSQNGGYNARIIERQYCRGGMRMIKEISKEQAVTCLEKKEFGADIICAASKVAVILTQSWCPQWLAMKRFVGDVTGCEVFFVEYDLVDYFERFRTFKEKVFGNDEIPYIRYYEGGKLIAESNAVSQEEFLKRIGITNS